MYRIAPYNETMKEAVVKFILSILEDEFHHTGIERPDLDDITLAYQKNNGNFWVAFDEEKIIGTAGLIDYGTHRGYIKRMSIEAKYRGTGLAQKLLSTLLDFAKSHQYKNLYLATSPNMTAAQKFYEKEGFKKISELPDDFPVTSATIFYTLEI